jgi:hypothetical protein
MWRAKPPPARGAKFLVLSPEQNRVTPITILQRVPEYRYWQPY